MYLRNALVMVVKVGINGFGRIGRIVTRTCLQNPDLELSAINDPAISVEYVCYLLKFDSTHGKLQCNVSHTDHEIIIDGRHVKIFHEKLPPSIPWRSADVQYVVEASGMFTNLEKASGHLKSEGVKRVLVTAPSNDIPMIILGVNDENISPECKVMSCTSSTLYCLSPIIKVLEDNYGVKNGFITSIHAMTPSLKPLDGLCLRGRHWRDHRGIHQNIIPAATGACKALGKIMPQVKNKLSGLAFRVPIVNVSVLDLTVRLKTFTTLRDIGKSIEQASKTALKNIIKLSKEESVSSDFIGESYSCVYDEDSSMQLTPDFFKIICWYENEYSYACRVIDTITFCEHQIVLGIPIKITEINQMTLKENVVNQTECYKKETCTVYGKPGINTKTISSISQGTGADLRPLLVKNHLSATIPSSHSSKLLKRDELFRIWNDSNENSKPSAKQNRNAILQRCMGFILKQPPNKLECNAHERLESVKKEFTKMVNITEDLLKKTLTNQSNIQQIAKGERKNLKDNNLKPKDDTCKGDAETCRKYENNKPVEECGDHKSFVDLRDTFKTQKELSKYEAVSLLSYDKNNSSCSEYNNNKTITKDTNQIIEIAKLGINRNNEIKDNLTSKMVGVTKFIEEPNLNSNCKQQLTKTINTLVDGLSQNIQAYVCNTQNAKAPIVFENPNKNTEKRETVNTRFSNSECEHVLLETNGTSEIRRAGKKENKIDEKISKYTLNVGKSHIKVIDKELRKRNIILVNNTFESETEPDLCVAETNKRYLPKKILKELTYPSDVVANVTKDKSKCETPGDTSERISDIYGNKQDVFDKLDSASGSDSNNSFDVNEKKSQVIQIADLTNSLEDLVRLDKICKIIEISDDLSNKLFSALDDAIVNDIGKVKQMKRWSFKDFCERIKLDEFCNKVFGEVSHTQ